jgi:hypothetical protein
LQDAEFLLSRPDITHCIEALSILVEWNDSFFEQAGFPLFDDFSSAWREFFGPIVQSTRDIIRQTPNTQQLYISGVVVSDIIKADIISLKKLHSLKLNNCFVHGIMSQNELPSSVVNLVVRIVDDRHQDPWIFLPSLPNLRTLSLSLGNELTDPGLPHPTIIRLRNPLVTLERLAIDGLRSDDWVDLIRMVAEASASTRNKLRLTHFKLALRDGMPTPLLDALLSGLEEAPLQVLVLKGIRNGSPELIERIAQLFPDLLSLTLYYYDSDRQHRSRGTVWPFPTWEYAQRLGRFNRLKHFGWNFAVDLVYLPAVMPYFEDGFPEEFWTVPNEVLDDWDGSVAKLFAVHQPSLESMAFVQNNFPAPYCRFTRLNSEGCIDVASSFGGGEDYYAEHCPPDFMGWPSLPLNEKHWLKPCNR